jgi:DNA-binding MarR family transcriptional regulator
MVLARHIKTLTENKLKNYGIGTGQLQLLMLFYQSGSEPLSQGDIVDALKIDKANVSRNVQKLVEKKWIETLPENLKKYSLTNQGKSLKSELGGFFRTTHGEMVRDIEEEALVEVMETLHKMISNLEDTHA